ncbi:MAG: ribbon-helix-helix protein, CopG family [Actinomycetota bacterium]
MTRKQVLVQLDDAQVAVLDRLASASDDSRSELIRRAIDLYVEAVGEAVADVHYAEAYERVPEDLDEFADLRALSAEAWPED